MNRIWNSLKSFLKSHWQPMKAATHCAHWIYFNFKSKWKLNGTKIVKVRSNLRDCNRNFKRSSIYRWTCPFHILIKVSIIFSLKNDCFYCGFSAHLRVCSDDYATLFKEKSLKELAYFFKNVRSIESMNVINLLGLHVGNHILWKLLNNIIKYVFRTFHWFNKFWLESWTKLGFPFFYRTF